MNFVNCDKVKMSYFNYVKRETVVGIEGKDTPMTFMDLTLCVEGEMHYWYNGEDIVLRPGDGILILPGSYRERYETTTPTLYASANLIFDSEESFEFEGFLPNVLTPDILYLLDIIKKDYPNVSSRNQQKCLSAFSYIYNSIYESVCNTENPHVKAIRQYIFDHLPEEITLEKISNHVHLAPQYICTLFKKETGMTIMQFILKSRIGHAKTGIVATNDPISKIAEGCGFDDYCYFSHVFKKLTGMSARQYRKTKRM